MNSKYHDLRVIRLLEADFLSGVYPLNLSLLFSRLLDSRSASLRLPLLFFLEIDGSLTLMGFYWLFLALGMRALRFYKEEKMLLLLIGFSKLVFSLESFRSGFYFLILGGMGTKLIHR
jgi:hypothetical protein